MMSCWMVCFSFRMKLWLSSTLVFRSSSDRSAGASSSETYSGDIAAICIASSRASARKPSSRATKSVSQFSSTMAPMRPPACKYASMTPWLATRPAFFWARSSPCLCRISSALPRSPPASSSARRQSITPAPVFSRSSLIAFVLIAAIDGALLFAYSTAGDARRRCVDGLGLGNVVLDRLFHPVGCRLTFLGFRQLGLAHLLALDHRVGDLAGEQLDGADRVVVGRNRVVDLLRVAIRVDDRDEGDLEPARLRDGDLLLV